MSDRKLTKLSGEGASHHLKLMSRPNAHKYNYETEGSALKQKGSLVD